MYQKYGSTHIFRMSWIARNLIVLAWVCGVPCLIILGFALQSPESVSLPREQLITTLVIGFFMMMVIYLLWTRVIPTARKAIVLQVDPEGVSSYYLHGAIIRWADLHDIRINTYPYSTRKKTIPGTSLTIYWQFGGTFSFSPAGLEITLILRENSPSWFAIPRPWIFWRSSSIDIVLIALPAEEQVQAVLALRAAFARYGGETAYQLMRGIRQDQMAEAFEKLAWLPEDLKHPDFTLPPRDTPDANAHRLG